MENIVGVVQEAFRGFEGPLGLQTPMGDFATINKRANEGPSFVKTIAHPSRGIQYTWKNL